MIASSKRDKHGAQVLTLSYTGTTKEAAEASRQSRLFSEAEDSNFESQIRDHTGSGYEHFPEDQAPEQVRKELGNSALTADTPIIVLWGATFSRFGRKVGEMVTILCHIQSRYLPWILHCELFDPTFNSGLLLQA